jgi:hypothetical protein
MTGTVRLSLAFCIAVIAFASCHAQCADNEILVGQDEKFWYCSRAADFPEAAATLVFALDAAAKKVNPDKSLDPATQDRNCSAFFRETGRKIGASGEGWTREDFTANDVARVVAADEKHWEKLTGSVEQLSQQIQKLANLGVIVVALQPASPHGHIAIASPMPPQVKLDAFSGHGPMVRDGNVHLSQGKKKPSGWGAVRASYAFEGYTAPGEEPSWYVWLPSVHTH